MKNQVTTNIDFDWNAFYERMIADGSSHKDAIQWANLADRAFALNGVEIERIESIPLHLKEDRNSEH